MLSYSLKRIGLLLPVLFGMTLVVFSITRLIPGNPAQVILGQRATKEAIEELSIQLGLNNPWYVQYGNYIMDLLRGDLGTSIKTKASISEEMMPYLLATIELTAAAMILAVIIGVNAGIISAWFRNSFFDYTSMVIALIGVSIPIFWLGLMMQWYFSLQLDWFPITGRENVRDPVQSITGLYLIDTLVQGRFDQFVEVLRHLVLPSAALATIPTAIIARITRASMIEVIQSDYMRTARAKGVKMVVVIYKHGLKNAVIPILTIIGLQTGLLLGGAILTETIFGWPGIGRYIYEAIGARDYPVIQSGILVIATIFVLINFIVDLLYALIDKRITY
ncbi:MULTISPECIES: ABC transporter permease [Bacillus]|uniref:Peptide ABC transporter permease n=2 Tax=Bacillus TaxID=1386 RepID=A0A0M4FE72_9BACI|nr:MULTISPECIES: ABC transporter permease [Bacillus]ALC80411.1 peptide ABC transporter permease [Bacillus gobiensis]MBP1083733.1 peptide/nickel transport system permease protein [Bacillus capparidis]MED1098219.1 ABC transporter permease [Bacillus capparidis]